MKQLYGYKKEEVERFINYLKGANTKNRSEVFAKYAELTNRSCGSIRNMYYAIAKAGKKDADFCNRYLNGNEIKVERADKFTKEETEMLIKAILKGNLDGKSVRRTINELTDNEKTALRYQNKYRNVVKKDGKMIAKLQSELERETGKRFYNATNYLKTINLNEYNELKTAVENLINRIRERQNEENSLLKSRLLSERQQNERLKKLLFGKFKQ